MSHQLSANRFATRASTRPQTVGAGRAGDTARYENDYDDLDGAGPSREPSAPLPAPAVPSDAVGGSSWEQESVDSDDSVGDRTYTLPPRSGIHDFSDSDSENHSDHEGDEEELDYVRRHDVSMDSVESVEDSGVSLADRAWVRRAEVNAPGTASFVWRKQPAMKRHGAWVDNSG